MHFIGALIILKDGYLNHIKFELQLASNSDQLMTLATSKPPPAQSFEVFLSISFILDLLSQES